MATVYTRCPKKQRRSILKKNLFVKTFLFSHNKGSRKKEVRVFKLSNILPLLGKMSTLVLIIHGTFD